ncbi:hypothetical protein [Lysobacter sp. GCM10012299]|uniref:hypothetical protein n=1 Tax=Lysobacter sp. GCM10012299 TaxID=3317333 RepID=UPI003622F892
MRLTLGLTGMDPATETALQAAFQAANGRLGGRWQMLPDTQADYVIVDMDSMYGPMSWLRLHAAGKSVIALTVSQRSQTDFRLANPFDSGSVATLLREIGIQAGVSFDEAPAAPAPAPVVAAAPAPTPAPAPAPAPSVAAAPPAAPAPVAPAPVAPAPAAVEAPAPVAAAAPAPAAKSAATSNDSLLDWLANDRLKGRMRVRGDEVVLIDMEQRVYHGPAGLKALAPLFEGKLTTGDFISVDANTWDAESARLGAAMPLVRLVWFGNLLAGKGALAPEHDPQRRYQMVKWPQTERDYPKHFRIATVMMKGPALIPEIAEASGVSVAEVADFINANLATGFAEVEREPEPLEAGKSGSGLFGRLRGR